MAMGDNENTSSQNNLEEYQEHNIVWRRPAAKETILYGSIYTKYKIR